MAITNVIGTSGGAGVSAAVLLADATAFTITEPTTLLADGLLVGENLIVYRLGPSGEYKPATNKDGAIVLSAYPNTALLDAPNTYKVPKPITSGEVHVGYVVV